MAPEITVGGIMTIKSVKTSAATIPNKYLSFAA